MLLSKDPVISVRIKFLQAAIPTLNEWIGASDQSLVVDLIQIVDSCKSAKEKELSDTAYEIDEKI